MAAKSGPYSDADIDLSQFDWLQTANEVNDKLGRDETAGDKFMRKFKQNPMVPIGCLATFGALTYGLWSFRKGKRQMSQYMMRLRIAAQGFTVLALMGGIAAAAVNPPSSLPITPPAAVENKK